MGIDRIEYTKWKGKKTPFRRRFFVIAEKTFLKKLKAQATWILLILGYIFVHIFTIASAPFYPREEFTKELILDGKGTLIGVPYLKGYLFFLFTIILVALVCSDLLSQDIRENSFVLYFSRPLRTIDYIGGKLSGSFAILTLYCAVPPISVGISVIATQTGNNYLGSLEVLGLTVLAGLFTSFIFLPYAFLLSSLTERKAYSGVGTFMTFFVLTIISDIFTSFDTNWKLVSPENLLHFSYDIIYGSGLPNDIDTGLYTLAMVTLIFLPLLILFIRVRFKEVEG
ncbi:MAG: ABC transporter permease subunit [Candidatus Saliniplasma sp.]